MKFFFQSISSIKKVLRESSYTIHLPSPFPAENIHILANGPSLSDSIKKYEKDFLAGDIMCVNSFVLTEYFEKFKPKYYVLADPIFWKSEKDEEVEMTILQLQEKTKWDLVLFIPNHGLKVLEQVLGNHPKIKLYCYNTTPFLGGYEFVRKCLYKKYLATPRVGSVLVACIFIGLKMNYKCIYIYGADHSWLEGLRVNDNNELCILDKHFYGEAKLKPWKEDGQNIRVHAALEMYINMFKGYEEIVLYLKYMKSNQKILNRSKYSFIDSFERSI